MIQVSGNEYISLANISENDGAIKYITVLNMHHRGMLQLEGDNFISPQIKINNKIINLNNKLKWFRLKYWIPQAVYENEQYKIKIIYLAPNNQKAIALRIVVENKSEDILEVETSFILNWLKTYHVVNESYEIKSEIIEKESNWNHGYVYNQLNKLPLISLSTMKSDNIKKISQNESMFYDYYLGVGYEEVSSSTAAKHLKRIGFDTLIGGTLNFLEEKLIKLEDKYIEKILNNNLFFAYYYSLGKTLDSEELVLVTSRSPRYYVSAAYWDRDSLLWSFYSILLLDEVLSKDILIYVFTKQIKNVGEHSRFIDGTLLEPGFELDELCAPVIALNSYVEKTNDYSILEDFRIKDGLIHILNKLKTKKHNEIYLFKTFLMPSDDFTNEQYLTYNNALVYKSLIILSHFLNLKELKDDAIKVKRAIYENLVVDDMFVYSSDLNGNFSIYDEPPGSLQLLNYLGFCDNDSIIWKNTVNFIRSKNYRLSFYDNNISEIGCDHAPHPWVLSLCNSLLCGFGKQAIENLKKMKMDNYIACESVDEESGECSSGKAFATCAGFLAYCINNYYTNKNVNNL